MEISPSRILKVNLFVHFAILLLLITTSANCNGQTLLIDNFSNGLSANWQKKSFKGETNYKIISAGSQKVLEATSNNSASGLFYKIDYNPEDYPFLTWKWKIQNVLSKGDALNKEGDDYPARIYVVFPGFFFWQIKAINYIWANKLPKGEFTTSTYTSNAAMIAVESGNTNAGRWREETRNIVADYRKAFGEAPPNVGSIAIMTDTDNTGETAHAWYGTIKITSEMPQNKLAPSPQR